MKLYAIIVAAGCGSRMGSHIPKQFLLLNGKPVFSFSVQTFLTAFPAIQVILVVPSSYELPDDDLLIHFDKKAQIKVIAGGSSRFESVKKGLSETGDEGIVFIHDAVRPFIESAFLHSLLETTSAIGNAIPCTDMNDSLRMVTNEENHPVDRSRFKAIQTPQVFQISQIKKAYELPFAEQFTDDASVLEADGHNINLVKGLPGNMKITTPVDFEYAALKMARQSFT